MSRVQTGGADFLILAALRAGHRQLPGIAAYARVERQWARSVLNRLRSSGQIRRYGNTRHARYIPVKRRRRNVQANAR